MPVTATALLLSAHVTCTANMYAESGVNAGRDPLISPKSQIVLHKIIELENSWN